MTTIKSYTDLEQSRKLAEILPPKSADMNYFNWDNTTDKPFVSNVHENLVDYTPCWSLAALLQLMSPEFSVKGTTYSIDIYAKNEDWFIDYKCNNEEFVGVHSDNLLNACVDMIEKLHELNLL